MIENRQKLQVLILLAVLLVCGSVQSQDSTIVGQLLMRLTSMADPDAVVEVIGGSPIDSIPEDNIFLVEFPISLPVQNAIEALSNNPEVVFAQPNYEISLPEIQQMSIAFPDENAPAYLEGTNPGSLYAQPAVYNIGMDSAQLVAHGEGIIVAIIDNGIDFGHPYLAGYIDSAGYDFIDYDNLAAEEAGEAYGHGTFVSGLVRLVADQATLLPIRAFDGDGVGNTFTVTAAINQAVELGADIINMSFVFLDSSASLETVCANAVSSGVVLVGAAGNQGDSSPAFPAALPDVIAVSGVDTLEYLADFSNYGSHIDVCAPAVNLYSSLAGEHDWGTWSGTSFGAPLVTGACALVKSSRSPAIPLDMQAHIRITAETELMWGAVVPPDPYYGYGRVDVWQAVMTFSYGDLNVSGEVEIGDLTTMVGFFFNGEALQGIGIRLSDFDCNGSLDISDLVALVEYMFSDGPEFTPCY